MGRWAVENWRLARWGELEWVVALRAGSAYLKQDTEFQPRQGHGSTRWQANVSGRDYEILCTGPHFLDTRTNQGGGGAVDMVMHLMQLDFRSSAAVLKAKQL